MDKEKKEMLLRKKKRSRDCFIGAPKLPRFEIHEIGSSLQFVFTCGLDNRFILYEIIRVLHEENVEVKSVNSSTFGDLLVHVVHAKVGERCLQFGGTKVSERLKRFVNESTSDEEIIQPKLGDFEMGTDLWGF
ncbi:transcription factor bHLH162-like [Cicer arietinum]|uniref:Transcription factor bHLH162-like n=1 Tax=Cicer arietinum TaxID=3827 RepID=A0A3Q7YG28_CICAR|nr:transcription factor bHLH162-like [Cicer arietinum]